MQARAYFFVIFISKICIFEFQSGQSQEYYFWGSGIESDAQMKIYEQMPDIKTIRKEQTFLSEQDCRQ
jgi:hypothetical protein